MDLILLKDEEPEINRRVTKHEGTFSFLKRKMSSSVKIVYGFLHRETNLLQPVNKRDSRGIWKC